MNYKNKVLFLFGILLFGIGLSYFLGETFMEGFATPAAASATAAANTPASATAAPATAAPATAAATTPAATTSAATTAAATTPAAPATAATTPAAAKQADTTSPYALPSFALPSFALPSFSSPSFALPSFSYPAQKKYDNYNHYNDMTSTKYYGSTGTPINPMREDDEEISTDPEPNSSANNRAGNDYGTQYYSTLPPGIPASQIMPGDEHLYILKSEIVPPVCPACPAFPSASIVNNKDPPPPCPPCGRCPEASFECKKVPNYNAVDDEFLPIPVLNDFSSFGM